MRRLKNDLQRSLSSSTMWPGKGLRWSGLVASASGCKLSLCACGCFAKSGFRQDICFPFSRQGTGFIMTFHTLPSLQRSAHSSSLAVSLWFPFHPQTMPLCSYVTYIPLLSLFSHSAPLVFLSCCNFLSMFKKKCVCVHEHVHVYARVLVHAHVHACRGHHQALSPTALPP